MKKKIYSFKGCFKVFLLSAGLAVSSSGFSQDLNAGLKLHYTFEKATGTTVSDVTGNGYDGTLYGATVGLSNGKNSLILSKSGTDYLDMGAGTGSLISSLTDFSISCFIWVNTTNTNLTSNGNMIATFSNSLDSYNKQVGYMFLQAKRSRYSITLARYEAEQAVQVGTDVAKGKWVQFTYTQAGSTGNFYEDGVLKNTNTAVTLTPSSLGSTLYNIIAKPSYAGDTYLQDAQISDFRMYNRAITSDEVMILNGYSAEFIEAYNSLTLGNIDALTGNVTLPATSGTANIPVVWTSSMPLVITTDGTVNRPTQYDATVKLTATLTQTVGDVTYTLVKVFNATVKAYNVADDKLAEWNFAGNLVSETNGVLTVTDTRSGFVGTVKNDARIRTIGTSPQYNVLDLGSGSGYFDMGTEIGKAIYSLNDYTMMAYFRVDDTYKNLGNNGNFIWTFSNSDNSEVDRNGYIFGSLKEQAQAISTNYYSLGNQSIGKSPAAAAPIGAWHHLAYAQSGTVGTIYLDGVSIATGPITNLPSTAITIAGRTGTLYNWLGRSNFVSDSYLQKTLLYDFQLLKVAVSGSDLIDGMDGIDAIPATIESLNTAYTQNPDYLLPELTTELNNLQLQNLNAVKANIALPLKGTDNSINIAWKSSNHALIDSLGNVTRPDYYNYKDTLTASLTKNGQKATKQFFATVVANDGTQFANDLLVKYDFSSVVDSTVTDAAEKHFKGVLRNNATVKSIGTTEKYNVLNLGDSIGYFDMGPEVGKLMYNQNDYTIGAYFRIDESYDQLKPNGNFLWSFSNATDILTNATGYVIASLRNQAATISYSNWTTEQTVLLTDSASKGAWHHFAYSQNGIIGTIYLDGNNVKSDTVTTLPSMALPKPGLLGTLYNWIGRSCYAGNVYLRKAQVYDFRLYKTALTDTQVMSTVFNVETLIPALNKASEETPNAVPSISDSPYRVTTSIGVINILGLTGNEKVSVFDIAGRQLQMIQPALITVNAGVYIVRIDGYLTKVVVR